MTRQKRSVLLTGVYGVGKSTVAVEMAEVLETAGEPYAVVDLDFLGWFAAGDDGPGGHEMTVRNLAAVAANYLEAGVTSFVLAKSVRTAEERDEIEAAVGVPMRTVRLTLPIEVIEARLSGDPTTGRKIDLAAARRWLARETGVGVEEWSVENTQAPDVVAQSILDRLGWLGRGTGTPL